MEREKEIEAYIRRGITKMGGLFFKFTSPGNDGVPDRIAVFPDGRVVFTELKAQHGKLSAVQMYQIDRLISLHQQVCVVYGMVGAEGFLQDMQEHSIDSCAYDREGVCELREEVI